MFILLIFISVLPSASAAIEFYNFSDAKQGEIKNLIIENNDIPIQQISIAFNRNVKDLWLELQSFSNTPSYLKSPAQGKDVVYSYIHFRKSADFVQSKLDKFDMELIVSKSWLKEKGIASETLKVMKFDNNDWKEIEFVYLGEDEDSLIYLVSTSPLLHAIIGERGSVLSPPDSDDGIVEDVEQKRDSPITGASFYDIAFKGKTFWWIIGIMLIAVLVVLAFIYQSNKEKSGGKNEVIPSTLENSGSSSEKVENGKEKKEEHKSFMLSEDELKKNKEQVRKELGF